VALPPISLIYYGLLLIFEDNPGLKPGVGAGIGIKSAAGATTLRDNVGF
jgi:hypothetical protein